MLCSISFHVCILYEQLWWSKGSGWPRHFPGTSSQLHEHTQTGAPTHTHTHTHIKTGGKKSLGKNVQLRRWSRKIYVPQHFTFSTYLHVSLHILSVIAVTACHLSVLIDCQSSRGHVQSNINLSETRRLEKKVNTRTHERGMLLRNSFAETTMNNEQSPKHISVCFLLT